MKSLNQVILIGNLGIDPKVIDIGSGRKFITFTLATHERWKDKDGNYVQETDWHKIVVFNEQSVAFAESSLKKGDQVYLEGKIKSQEWTGEDGNKRINFEIHIPRFEGELKKVSPVEILNEPVKKEKAKKKRKNNNEIE